jgi:putative endonuclease
VRRVYEHKTGIVEGFTKKYAVYRLVYYEIHEDIENAIVREKHVKKWNRSWKVDLIEEKNLYWGDLYHLICR